jgi:hypothetical protein
MNYVVIFVAGAFLCNCIPHLGAGLQGETVSDGVAKPRGVGNSSPLLNFLWAVFNLCVGLYLLSRQPAMIGPNASFFALVAGGLAIGTYLSIHF